MTTDSNTVDARAKELFDLASQRICDVLNVTPAGSAAIMLALAVDQLDAPMPLAPQSLMAGLKGAVRVAESKQQPAQHFVVRW